MKKILVGQEFSVPCNYHPNDRIKKSTENPKAWVCVSCKKEKVEGRDGIYDDSDLINLISQNAKNKNNKDDKLIIRDEVWEFFNSIKEDR